MFKESILSIMHRLVPITAQMIYFKLARFRKGTSRYLFDGRLFIDTANIHHALWSDRDNFRIFIAIIDRTLSDQLWKVVDRLSTISAQSPEFTCLILNDLGAHE